jgi:hypothetical protein
VASDPAAGPSTTSTVTKCQWHRQLELEQPQAERFKFQGSVQVPTYTPALGRLGPDSNTVQQLLSSTTCSTQRLKQCRRDGRGAGTVPSKPAGRPAMCTDTGSRRPGVKHRHDKPQAELLPELT